MTNPIVSVIIPTYKHQDFVLATLDSVFAQTFTDYEVIVINDGSPDDTAEVLKPLAEAGRIRYIAQENQGQGAARNRGLAEAQGKFIAFLDDDDLWPTDKLDWQVAALLRRPDAGMVAGTADMINVETGIRAKQTPFLPEVKFEALFVDNPFVSPGQTLVRSSLLKQLNGLNPQIWGSDDWDLYFRIAKNSSIVMEDQVALLYQVHPNNASGQMKRMLDNSRRVIKTHLLDVNPKQRRKTELSAYQFLYSYLGLRVIDQVRDSAKSGNLRLSGELLVMLLQISRVLVRSRKSTLMLIRDTAPKSLRHQVSRLRGKS